MEQAKIVLTTVGLLEKAEQIAETLLERRLAACVNIIGPIRSIYRWQGALQREQEYLAAHQDHSRRAPLNSPQSLPSCTRMNCRNALN